MAIDIITPKLDKLGETKADIATAISEMGVEITETDTFASSANKIRNIHIPKLISEFENDVDYQTGEQVAALLTTKADLVNGVVPASQLPGFVDDVLEFYSEEDFPETGESGKIYLATSESISYRWTGTTYLEISSPIDVATYEEAVLGTDDTKMMTSLKTKASIDTSLANVLSEYFVPNQVSDITQTDSLAIALGKLEAKIIELNLKIATLDEKLKQFDEEVIINGNNS